MRASTHTWSAVPASGDDWPRDWGRLLRTARQVAGLSLTDLSARTGLSKGYLSKLEAGQDGARNPSRATLVAIARALPSFRPLAYQLEPADQTPPMASLALAEQPPRPPQLLIGDESNTEVPIQLGWREMELLVAVLALERSAIPVPLSARIIARAVDRTSDTIQASLDRLAAGGVLHCYPPSRPGAAPTYGKGQAFETRVGLSRLGDALVLAAALLAQSPALQNRRHGDED